jgi:hypothetical protein
LPVAAVKSDWARELSSYADRPDAVEHALAVLDADEPPTAARFRELCSSAPAPVFRTGPEPKQPQRAAEVRRKLLRPVAPRMGREVGWAVEVVQRARNGQRVSGYSLRLALDALGLQGTLR